MRRLFSTFAHGAPGVGLLLLRVVVAVAVVFHLPMALRGGPPVGQVLLNVLTGVMGILLLVGLWTPVAGAVLAVLELSTALFHPTNPWACILLGALATSLALLGPGAWSVDARLFGWKRVELPDRKS